MPRGGMRIGEDGTTNHLFTPKWNNKKTAAIRIPEVFKDALLGIARHLDKTKFSQIEDSEIVHDITNCFLYKEQAKKYQDELEEIKSKSKILSDETNNNSTQNAQKNGINKYKIAVECFDKYVESQKLNIEELSKERKGTKKRQLFEIHSWLVEQSNTKN